ncbi:MULTISPECIES: HesA/MoeB/ThiF family protein [unclassified Oceanispirochaeta]|uniref:HesA/MoeB/ThiF family protein n=1 Tax=unclassified Oceanispirochaeta TaxID=2635722 RepID=UPI000E095F78|nr:MULTISPECIES: HesA/MoeB/ThiF family protein [unclassified Oceanispirochaeta]MBF9018936.1 HesA/MoeB/ThiF family protein [Oceanispirochaeta sp. M2]NPD75456.1 HesA/MoeB/ThiF family protein [Oceanispirochaeta sp. M1]RDG28684.1 HesA/MoeB/ThiF family protein [Oceanispirochaeta sp. M1]
MFEDRLIRNGATISPEERPLLKSKKVFIAGCGGLGGYILEMLLRVGVGQITVADPDVFDESNLNRQLLSREDLLGVSKSQSAAERAALVNSEVKLIAHQERVTAENATTLCRDADIIMDALDSPGARIILEDAAEKLGIPMIHGAIAGWYGQVSAVFPGDNTMKTLYGSNTEAGMEVELGNPSFTPAIIAGIQVSEAVKVLLNKDGVLRHKLLYIDLLNQSYTTLEI